MALDQFSENHYITLSALESETLIYPASYYYDDNSFVSIKLTVFQDTVNTA